MENQNNIIRTALDAAQKPFIAAMPDGTPVVFAPAENGDWSFDTMPRYRAPPTVKKASPTPTT